MDNHAVIELVSAWVVSAAVILMIMLAKALPATVVITIHIQIIIVSTQRKAVDA